MTEPLLNLDDMTWTCMVCGDERPDALIGVWHRLLKGLEEWFPECRVNVRYCLDRAACVAVACEPGVWQPRERSGR